MQEASRKRKSKKSGSGLAPAFYPGKERWKREPGNRYTPGELAAMERNWEVRVTKPAACHSRSGD